MKVLQIVPRAAAGVGLKTVLKQKERELRGTRTTFVRAGEGRWTHKRYPGRIVWAQGLGGILVVEIRTPEDADDWQLLQAFIGYLDRHLREAIDSISITYRAAAAKPRRRGRRAPARRVRARAKRKRVVRRARARRRAPRRVRRRAASRSRRTRRTRRPRVVRSGKRSRGRTKVRPRRARR